jgi:oxygen-dependent protoporphyrinogen oxidase
MGMELFIPARKDDEDESLGHFIRRRLGQEALDKIAEPLMSGIHVSDPEQQSILGTFPRFRAMEKQHGSLIRAMFAQRQATSSNGHNGSASSDIPAWKKSMFISFRGGMGQLVGALDKALTDGQCIMGCEVIQVSPVEGGYRISTSDGREFWADAVILAAPAFTAARLTAPFAPDLAQVLSNIRYVSTATVSLAYLQPDLNRMQGGVGFIVPRNENRRITACTASSIKFSNRAPQNKVLLRCFVGGPGNEQAVERSDEEIIADVRAEMASLLNITAEPTFARVYRWEKGNAQYDVGHLERVKQIHVLSDEQPGLFLCGAAYDGIGIPDCIHQGQQAAEQAVEYLAEPVFQP